MSRLWAMIGSGASYVASARFEYKSLSLLGAGVAALYVMALVNPAEPYLGAVADAPAAFLEPQRETPVFAAVESLTALIIEESVLPDHTEPEAPVFAAVESLTALIIEESVLPDHTEPEAPVFAAVESFTALIIETSALPDNREPGSVASLVDLYRDIDYRLNDIRLGEVTVPRLLVDRIPNDIALIESPAERKRLFIKLALPLILHANERITADRGRLIALREKIARAAAMPSDHAWLDGLADRYGLETPDLDALLRRVDVIPPSLALAQGAEESGWGTSRFVREGNAIFGQRTFDKGAGLVPNNRDADKKHEVKAFNGLMDSVASYMTNLNTHQAYVEFRRIRAGQRASGYVDSYSLAGTLDRYSERGEDYIKTIRSIINKNDLRSFDRASLGKLVAGDSKI